jgi:amidohydrolase
MPCRPEPVSAVTKNTMKNISFLLIFLVAAPVVNSRTDSVNERILKIVEEITAAHREIYIDLHQNPELSLMEFETARKMAGNLESMGFEVTGSVGGNGVAGIFRNGPGKVIMLRTDTDALPLKETTGLPYASQAVARDASGAEVPVMHACGHDMHMTMWLGTLKTLVEMKDQWQGTILAIAQPAEEVLAGAKEMINDGLFKRFPVPDYALAYHVNSHVPAGTIAYCPGSSHAGTRAAEITIFGSGGHGAMPHNTIDPVVLASRIVLGLQTIVSRETDPVKPAVITVGSIKGGTKHNIIPDEVELLLTIRFFEDEIYEQIRKAIIRLCRGVALSAGLEEDRMPLVTFTGQHTPPVSNDPDLVMKVVDSMGNILGQDKVIRMPPTTAAEDFGLYGRTAENIPLAFISIGSANHELYHDHVHHGAFLAPVHHSGYAPDFYPTFGNGVAAMSRAVLDLFGNR